MCTASSYSLFIRLRVAEDFDDIDEDFENCVVLEIVGFFCFVPAVSFFDRFLVVRWIEVPSDGGIDDGESPAAAAASPSSITVLLERVSKFPLASNGNGTLDGCLRESDETIALCCRMTAVTPISRNTRFILSPP